MEKQPSEASSVLIALLALVTTAALIVAMLLGTSGVAVVFGAGSSNAVGANIIIAGTCAASPANTQIVFPTTTPGSFASTANAENVVIFGSTTSNIWVSGGAWANVGVGSPIFNVGNTLWNPTTGGNIGTQLTGASVDTKVAIFTDGSGFGNVVFFGLNIPIGTAGGAYNQIITVASSC